MAKEPQDLVLSLLREMRAEMASRFEDSQHRFDGVDKKLESLRQAMIGESVLGRYTVAEVEERFEKIESRLAALEKHN